MNQESVQERDLLIRQLGATEQQIRQLERRVAQQSAEWETDAGEWRRLVQYRDDLAEWLVDGATADTGKVVTPIIDAGLGGESFVPCSFIANGRGRRYRIVLVSTNYEVMEVSCNG